MMLDVLYPRDTVAYRGLSIFCSSCPHTEGGNKLAKELTRTFQEAEYLYASNDPVGRDTAAIIFAWCESMRRNAIPTVMESRFGHQFVEVVNSGGNLIDVIDPVQLSDLQALRIDAEEQISEWRKRIVSGAPYEPNPIFSGSGCVGGADADWIIDDTLIDCKTTKNLTNSWIRKALFQLLGYSLLDFTDYFEIRNIGLWLPRFRAFQVWNIYDILDISSKRELQKVRREFEKALTSDT
ncbi:hypothetical protein [Acidipropionibacterium virtanenii]|nr:hypothetical protein [Acidipropionibacterium virtanenii]